MWYMETKFDLLSFTSSSLVEAICSQYYNTKHPTYLPLFQMIPILRFPLLLRAGMQRSISTSMRLRCDKDKGQSLDNKPSKPTPTHADSLRNAYRPNRLEQRMLVWTKKYKSLDQVPTHVK